MQLLIQAQPNLNGNGLPEVFFEDGMRLELNSNFHQATARLRMAHRVQVDGYTENDHRIVAGHMRLHHRNYRLHLDLMRTAFPKVRRARIYRGNSADYNCL